MQFRIIEKKCVLFDTFGTGHVRAYFEIKQSRRKPYETDVASCPFFSNRPLVDIRMQPDQKRSGHGGPLLNSSAVLVA